MKICQAIIAINITKQMEKINNCTNQFTRTKSCGYQRVLIQMIICQDNIDGKSIGKVDNSYEKHF